MEDLRDVLRMIDLVAPEEFLTAETQAIITMMQNPALRTADSATLSHLLREAVQHAREQRHCAPDEEESK